MRMLPVYTYRQGASALGYMSKSKTTHLYFETPRSPSPPPPPFCFLFLSCLVMLHSGPASCTDGVRCCTIGTGMRSVRQTLSLPFDEFTHRRQSSLKSFPENQILSSARTASRRLSHGRPHTNACPLSLFSSVSFKIYALSRSPGIRLRWRCSLPLVGTPAMKPLFPLPLPNEILIEIMSDRTNVLRTISRVCWRRGAKMRVCVSHLLRSVCA